MKMHEASAAIFAAFETQWPGLSGGVPFVEQNESGEEAPTWARISIQGLGSRVGTIGQVGNHKDERHGIIHVQIFGPVDVGRVPLDILGQHVVTIFNRKTIANEIHCSVTDPANEISDGQYAGIKMSTRFWHYDSSG